MKTQMKFQKILCLVAVVMAALTFVYALCFSTGSMYALWTYTSENQGADVIGADNLFYYGQDVNETLLILSIIFIVLALTLYITASQSRRNYYITNYISIGATSLFGVIYAVIGFILVGNCLGMFANDIDWATYRQMHEANPEWAFSDSNIMFILGFVLFVLVILLSAALVLNLIWKIKLMQGEKALLAGNKPEEAAQPEEEVA